MREQQALDAFGALSQETRLQIIRLLVKAGPEGLAAGAVGEAVGAFGSTTSFHLSNLQQAGLVRSHRKARSIIYTAEITCLSALIGFLMKDCCGGRPEICGPLIAELTCPCVEETSHA